MIFLPDLKKTGSFSPILFILILSVVMPVNAEPDQMMDSSADSNFTIYYFHGTMRCTGCLMIEDLTAWLVNEALYPDRIEDGSLQLKILNTDEPDNSHLIQEFKLDGQALILAAYVDGEISRWKNLERIWELVDMPKDFEKYIKAETTNFFEPESEPVPKNIETAE